MYRTRTCACTQKFPILINHQKSSLNFRKIRVDSSINLGLKSDITLLSRAPATHWQLCGMTSYKCQDRLRQIICIKSKSCESISGEERRAAREGTCWRVSLEWWLLKRCVTTRKQTTSVETAQSSVEIKDMNITHVLNDLNNLNFSGS